MADDKVTTAKKPAFSLSPPVVMAIVAVLVVGGAVGYLTFGPKPGPPPPPVLTQEAKDYRSNFKFSNVALQASESYINSSLVEIQGNIGNTGNRVVKLAQVYCVFYSVYDPTKEVHRELVTLVGKTGALHPGETKTFRLAFDRPPQGWNQAMPQFVVAQIQFE